MFKIINPEKGVTVIMGNTKVIKSLYKSMYRHVLTKWESKFFQCYVDPCIFNSKYSTYGIVIDESETRYAEVSVLRGDQLLAYLIEVGYVS